MIGASDFDLGAAAGFAAAWAIWAASRWVARTRAPRARSPREELVREPNGVVLEPAASGAPQGIVAGAAPFQARALRPTVGSSGASDRVTLAERIIAHLFRFRGPSFDDLAPGESTQRGIVVALGADQRAVSKVLRRLRAAGVLEEERRHVRGGARRVNVYTLTRQGESLAVDIRRRLPGLRQGDGERTEAQAASPGLAPVVPPSP